MSDSEEILDRISREHEEGKHTIGPMAGCLYCLKESQSLTAQLESARADLAGEGGAAAALERLALARQQQIENGEKTLVSKPPDEDDEILSPPEGGPVSLREYREAIAAVPRGRHATVPIHGGTAPDRADEAETSIRAAMDALGAPGAQATQEGIVHALVACALATLALNETMRMTPPGEAG